MSCHSPLNNSEPLEYPRRTSPFNTSERTCRAIFPFNNSGRRCLATSSTQIAWSLSALNGDRSFPMTACAMTRGGWKSQGKDDAEINNLLNRRRWRGSLVVDVKLGACNKVRALGGSWKGGLAVLGGAAPPAEQIRIRLNFLHSLAGGCQTGRSAKNLAKLQEQRIVAAREVLEFVGGEELEETVALPRTRLGSSGCEAS